MDLNVKIVSRRPVFPSTRIITPLDVPLSIIDATVLNFSPSETVLLYDAVLSPEVMREALEETLDFYPQWCGRLRRNDKINRYGRLMLSYGHVEDPGVLFVVGETDVSLSTFLPTPIDRAQRLQAWDASSFPAKQLVPGDSLSTSNLDDPTLHSVTVQLTKFGCGGMAVGLKFAHPLTDAHAMSHFARDWAAMCRAIVIQSPLPQLFPVFDPQLLDAHAGDVNALDSDPELIARAHALHSHRYDWWISGEDCPYPTDSATVPKGLEPCDPPGTRIPWSEWDLAAPVSHYVFHFSGPELTRLWQTTLDSQSSGFVSRQDALLAHIWTCINRARGLSDDDGLVHLDYTLGLRARTAPPLPEWFMGSPLIIAAVSTTGRRASRSPAGVASLIRATVALFTPESVGAHIHAKFHEQSPQRLWQAFLGKRHLLVTSWIHTHMYDVDFGSGKPQYVEAVMPKCDGLLQLMEAAPVDASSDGPKHWSDDGVDVQLHLTTEAMEKLLKDPVLRRYRVE
ncbi:hypothetical protein K461DRAFT_240356 [Myriangium duriaei CBS 260.36]|uniref:Transferase n=1 Tax=Myriangium duriaei CBS 260.36 TaxID=1168546 RepID=A0A9P4MKD4_9PEZI|nr:hypothetical protein K461DRAFT_240356 [Myriangium duriaei CBS 260.36]